MKYLPCLSVWCLQCRTSSMQKEARAWLALAANNCHHWMVVKLHAFLVASG